MKIGVDSWFLFLLGKQKIKKSYTKGKLKKLVDTDKSLKEIDSLFGE